MDPAERASTLHYLHSSGAVLLLESIVQTLLKTKPPSPQVLGTLREAALEWVPQPQKPISCRITTVGGCVWLVKVEGGRAAAYRDGTFVQYVSKALCDAASRRLSLDRLVRPEDSDAIQLPAEGFAAAMGSLATVCDAAGVLHELNFVEPLQFSTCDDANVKVCMEAGELVWHHRYRFVAPVRSPSFDVTSSRLQLDEKSDALELKSDGLRPTLSRLAQMCDYAGVTHRISVVEGVALTTTDGCAWQLMLDRNNVTALRGGEFVQRVTGATCDVAALRLRLLREDGDPSELCLVHDGSEEALLKLRALCEHAGLPHRLQTADCVTLRTQDGREVRMELDDGWPSVYIDGVFRQYATRVACDVVNRCLILDKQSEFSDPSAIKLPLCGFRSALTKIGRMCDAAGVPHQLDVAEPLQFTTQDGATLRIVVEDGWPAAYRGDSFLCYVTQLTADVAHRRLALDKQVRPEDPDAVRLQQDTFIPLLGSLQSLCDGLGVPSQLCTFYDAHGSRWRIGVDEDWPVAYRDGAFSQLVSHCQWSLPDLTVSFDRGTGPLSDGAVKLPAAGAENILQALAALCDMCGVPHDALPGPGSSAAAASRSDSDEQAAQKIQALARGRRGRKKAAQRREEKRREEEEFFESEEREYVDHCAKLIQGLLVRKFVRKVKSRVQQRKRYSEGGAARKIQALQRGRRGRQRAKEREAERLREQEAFFEEEERSYEDYCARIIQNAVVARFIRKMRKRLESIRTQDSDRERATAVA
eukprot:TRINITY_DN32959_c0_g1_i1.p1 TRINITY_DN32959_c0_g1~~TRINITY_DN32959_c0_g1_i1.p1  ORF type:complete len:757 (+),score=189.15 TRINITY_DN32959_c0_g1_i1:65-2335(+)